MTLSDILKAVKDNNVDALPKAFDVNIKTEKGNPLLYVATEFGHVEMVKWLIQQGADVDATNLQGFTALHIAARQGHLAIAEWLLREGAHCNKNHSQKKKYNTPLHVAAIHGHVEIVDLLIRKGADIYRENKQGMAPLVCAVEQGHTEVVNLLINAPSMKRFNTQASDALSQAIWNGRITEAQSLFNIHVNPCKEMRVNGSWHNFLSVAAMKGHVDIAAWLLSEKIIGVDDCNELSVAPLHTASRFGNLDFVEKLLKYGASIEIKTRRRKETPLFYARDLDMVNLLLDRGANINAFASIDWPDHTSEAIRSTARVRLVCAVQSKKMN